MSNSEAVQDRTKTYNEVTWAGKGTKTFESLDRRIKNANHGAVEIVENSKDSEDINKALFTHFIWHLRREVNN